MKCDSWASLLAFTLASPYLGHEPKVRVATLLSKKFQVNTFVQQEMHQPRTIAQYELMFISVKSYCAKFVIIKSLNIHSLTLHF
jgi:hypothetical protein